MGMRMFSGRPALKTAINIFQMQMVVVYLIHFVDQCEQSIHRLREQRAVVAVGTVEGGLRALPISPVISSAKKRWKPA